MTDTVATNTSTTIQLDTGDRLYVPRDVGVIVPATNSTAIEGSDVTRNALQVVVDGTAVSLGSSAVALYDNAGVGLNTLIVGSTGIVRSLNMTGGAAAYLSGSDSRLANWGELSGGWGAYLDGFDGGVAENHGILSGRDQSGLQFNVSSDVQALNTGLISGASGVTFAFSHGRVENSGEIFATSVTGVAVAGASATGAITVVNSGHLSASLVAVQTAGFADRVVNTGTIDGDVQLNGGADLYRGRGTVDGQVLGGDGEDTLLGGTGDDVLSGEGDGDRIEGRGGDDTLDGGAGADSLRGGAGRDVLSGGNGADQIGGGNDDDTLDGGAGADILNGGRGDDTLTGGGGNDIFIFKRNAGDDVITDFQNGADRIDLSAFGLRAADFASVVAPALSNAGGATLLDLAALGGSGSVLIEGLGFNSADAGDFIL